MEKETVNKLIHGLTQFRGSENYYRHFLTEGKSILLTEGVNYLAETAACYWLLDIITSYQDNPKAKKENFQVWTLLKKKDNSWKVICTDGNRNILITQKIPFSDFPLETITIWLANNTAMLPSEY